MGWDISIGQRDWNYTHNTNPMIREAGIPDWPYDFLDRVSAKGEARDMIKPLTLVIKNMASDPEKYRKMNPANGWGDYDGVMLTLAQMLNYSIANPNLSINHFS